MSFRTNKIQINCNSFQRIVGIATFILSFGVFGIHAQAHTPHDMIRAFTASPDFAIDKTMFAVTDGAYTGWRYDEILRSTDVGLN